MKRTSFAGSPMTVATIWSPPFVTKLDGSASLGFVMDLLRVLEDKFNFVSSVVPSSDGLYGAKINGTWNGFVRMLREGTADIVAAGFAMTLSRAEGTHYKCSESGRA